MEIILRNISELKNYERNARTHSDAQVEEIADSIKTFGFNDPIEIGLDDVIISGHARLAAAIKLGLTQVPTICHEHLEPTKRKGYILAANRIAQNAAWDNMLLKEEFETLQSNDFDLLLTGFSQDEIDAILNPEVKSEGTGDADSVPAVSETTKTKRGDIWILGDHRLMCGDSSMVDDVEKLTGGAKVDMVFTDPPYNLASENKLVAKTTSKSIKKLSESKWDCDFNIQSILTNLYTVLADNVTVYVCTSQHLAPEIWSWMKPWAQCFGWCVWSKTNPMPSLTKRHWTWNGELICYATRGKHTFNFPKNGHALSIWEISNDNNPLHPTQKPVALAEHAISHSSAPGMWVADFFGGSGTTLIACEKLGRKCLMMELDEKYCDVIVKRWQKFIGKEAVLESTGELFSG